MCIRDSRKHYGIYPHLTIARNAKQQATPTGRSDDLRLELEEVNGVSMSEEFLKKITDCLLYTSDAADERSSVDLGGRRIIKKKTKRKRIAVLLQHR
mgnify:CR=1 FL=1